LEFGIDRFTPGVSGIGIYTLLPGKGATGVLVKIQGYGFSTTPANKWQRQKRALSHHQA
jgi:hypothetical protein